ncbi:hypothetical protein SAY86_017959 [Trapa natans]|uniref:Uncharacterized protein n=1 Tax=Trapa natans TaxID=22666 RepID=A0AAN7R740_TRANT|nr:hypothetical protein SAY86_017959 [Trapa natans]
MMMSCRCLRKPAAEICLESELNGSFGKKHEMLLSYVFHAASLSLSIGLQSLQSMEIETTESSNWLPDYGYVKEVDYNHRPTGSPTAAGKSYEHSDAPVGYLPLPPAVVAAQGQVAGHKLIPYIGFSGVAMRQFITPAVVDTLQDHVLRPPVALLDHAQIGCFCYVCTILSLFFWHVGFLPNWKA